MLNELAPTIRMLTDKAQGGLGSERKDSDSKGFRQRCI
jgi:hypothetical protein